MEDVFAPEPDSDLLKDKELMRGDTRVQLALRVLRHAQESVKNAIELLESSSPTQADSMFARLTQQKRTLDQQQEQVTGARVLEGVFDGQQMTGSDGKPYPVPPNYASKSRLVEGDVLKLTVRGDGSFLYKQIGPIERRRCTGRLAIDPETSEFAVVCDDSARWRVLRASITYFKGTVGDDVIVLVPKSTPATWAAVENVIKQGNEL